MHLQLLLPTVPITQISTPSILPPLLADSWWPPHHPCWSQHYWAEPHNTRTVATVLHQTTFLVLSETHRDKSETTKPRQLKRCQKIRCAFGKYTYYCRPRVCIPTAHSNRIGTANSIHVESCFLNQVINSLNNIKLLQTFHSTIHSLSRPLPPPTPTPPTNTPLTKFKDQSQ